jgi:hypothetical protein
MKHIYKNCYSCDGTGILTRNVVVGEEPSEEEYECPTCSGEGEITSSCIHNGTDIFHSYEVLEQMDATEYNALTDAKKAGLDVLLGCGLVDLNDGKLGKTRIWAFFGEESTTVENLTALLT